MKKKKTIKKLKEEISFFNDRNEKDKVLDVCLEAMKLYPNNEFGYTTYIMTKTNNYNSYIEDSEIKDVKKIFEKLYEVSSKKDKNTVKDKFDEYVQDCKEVNNLKKIKKTLTSKYFLKRVYEESIKLVNKNVKIARKHYKNGIKIRGVYDLIKGILFAACLIFNLINRNILLIFTIPFGAFGIINIYSFIDNNFVKKDKTDTKNEEKKQIIEKGKNTILEYEDEIKKLDDMILFLSSQKNNCKNKIPNTFMEKIEYELEDNEDNISKKLMKDLKNNNYYRIEEYTDITNEQFKEQIYPDISNKAETIFEYLNQKNDIKNIFKMKNISIFSYISLIIFCFISAMSFIIIIKNFYELNLLSFVLANVSGLISILTYNIETGKHSTLADTFGDNLLICVFKSSLVYDLIYSYITNEVNFTYGFLEIPIIFVFLYIGPSLLISILKYKHLYNKVVE